MPVVMVQYMAKKAPAIKSVGKASAVGRSSQAAGNAYGARRLPGLVIVVSGSDGVVEYISPGFAKLLGRRQVAGQPMRRAFPELAGQGWFDCVQECLAGKRDVICEGEVFYFTSATEAGTVACAFSFEPSTGADGKTPAVTAVGLRAGGAFLEFQQAYDDQRRYRDFMQNSNIGIWRYELDEPIATSLPPERQVAMIFQQAYLAEANDAMAKMYGYDTADSLVGSRLHQLMDDKDPDNIAYLKAFVANGYTLTGVDSHEKDRYGNDKYLRNSLTGVVRDGLLVRAWGTQQDITEQQLSANALRQSEERLELALRASKLGIWEWDIATGELMWSDQLKLLYGLQPDDKVDFERYQELVHPDYREALQQSSEYSLKTGESYEVEHKIIWPDGSEHWTLGRGQAIFVDGQPVRMIGTAMNIDDRKQAELQVRQSQARLRRSERLKTINEALRTQRSQLLALNNSKDEFISLASHQLRTPATGVKQYIGMMLEGFSGELGPEHTSLLQVAYESNERQLRIIDDLLRVAHIDAGRVELRKSQADLAALICDVVKEQHDSFERRGQQVICTVAPQAVPVSLDAPRIRMVIENLIDNAGKYSPDGSQVHVGLDESGSSIAVAIRDQGIGISDADIDKLFQKFSRLNNEQSAKVDGTGLGLYWAKKIVDMHGGQILVESETGKGTTFTIVLPKEKM